MAQPIKKKPLSASQEAEKIRDDLKLFENEGMEEKLKKTADAVKKLQDLQKKVEQKKDEKCPNDKKTYKLKDEALKLLDELESRLDTKPKN